MNIANGLYRHYKGKDYEVIGVAQHSETDEMLVVYKPLYETEQVLWVRPLNMFLETLQLNGKTIQRFRKLTSAEAPADDQG